MTEIQLTAGGTGDAADRRFAEDRHTGAYLTTGVLMVLYGLVPAGWTAYTLIARDTPFGDFLLAMIWPVGDTHVAAMSPYEWAFALALIVVGICALARRRAARGGALLFAFALLFASVREAVGLLDDAYRTEYFASDEGPWLLATRLFGLLVAVVVLSLMLRARDDRGPRTGLTAFTVAGVVLVLAGGLRVAGVAVQRRGSEYFASILDPTGESPTSMYASVIFYDATITVSLLVLGVLALLKLRVARGAALALLPVAAYVGLFTVVPLFEQLTFDAVFRSAELALFVGAEVASLVAALIVVPLLATATGRRGGADGQPLDPAAFAPFPGDVGQQHPGRH
ncbi:MAG: hypothetical protein ACRDQB_09345 [Thermocrispum sp.]